MLTGTMQAATLTSSEVNRNDRKVLFSNICNWKMCHTDTQHTDCKANTDGMLMPRHLRIVTGVLIYPTIQPAAPLPYFVQCTGCHIPQCGFQHGIAQHGT